MNVLNSYEVPQYCTIFVIYVNFQHICSIVNQMLWLSTIVWVAVRFATILNDAVRMFNRFKQLSMMLQAFEQSPTMLTYVQRLSMTMHGILQCWTPLFNYQQSQPISPDSKRLAMFFYDFGSHIYDFERFQRWLRFLGVYNVFNECLYLWKLFKMSTGFELPSILSMHLDKVLQSATRFYYC